MKGNGSSDYETGDTAVAGKLAAKDDGKAYFDNQPHFSSVMVGKGIRNRITNETGPHFPGMSSIP